MFPVTVNLVQNFVLNNALNQIWAWNNVVEGNWNTLTRNLWHKFFSDHSILRPIEDIDKRFDVK